MLRMILEAVRARAGEALTVMILAALAAAAAAAAPWYGLAVGSRVAENELATAPAAQRVLTASRQTTLEGDPQAELDRFAASVRDLLPIAGGTRAQGLTQQMIYTSPTGAGASSGFAVAYREGFCTHVRLAGTCPAGVGDAAISRDVARRLHLAVGDAVVLRLSPSAEPVSFRVVGVYALTDPSGAYWSDTLFGPNGELDPLFTPLATFRDPQLAQPTLAYDLELPANLLRGDNGYDLNGVLNQAQRRFNAAQITLTNPTGELLDRILADRTTILRGILIALAQVLVLAWFAMGLAGRYTGRDRRGDAALLTLRGNTRFSILRLAAGEHLIALACGAAAGAPLGVIAASLLAGHLPVRPERWLASGLSAAAAVVAVLVGLAVLTAVDAAVLRLPVVTLLRTVPSGRRDWRADVVDLVLVLVAAGAVYQARTSRPDSGLGLVAPAVAALTVALLLARLLGWVADRTGAAALRAGRLRFGLTAVHVSRRPGTDRVFALIVVAVAMAATAAGGYAAGRTERIDRSRVELGATRVLTVRAASRTQLEYAVRHADPAGRYAMAAVVDRTTTPPVLALDSSRLGVAIWRGEYGSRRTLPDAMAAAPAPAPLPLITGTGLTLGVRNDRDVPAVLDATLQNEATGAAVRVEFTAPPGEGTVSAPVAGCRTPPGCRLVRWELFTPADRNGESVTGTVTLRSLSQQDPSATIVGTAELGDVTRWHTDYTGVALQIATTGAGLRMSSNFRAGPAPGDKVYVVDTPLPLPVVLAGPPPSDWHFADPSSLRFGPASTPVRIAGTASVLPVLGRTGVLVDLDASRRLAADADLGGSFQVWLAADAPRSLPDALSAAGLTVVADDSTAARADRLSRQASVIAARFGVLTVAIVVLIAAAALAVVGAVDRGSLGDRLQALRTQGLPLRTAVATGRAGTAGLVLAGLLGGLVAAVLARPAARVVAPPFADGWRVIDPPDPLGPAALAVAAALASMVLGVTAAVSVRPLIRRLRGGGR